MFLLHALNCDLECRKFIAISDRDLLESLDLHAELIDDSPGHHLLFGDPNTGLFIISFPKEEFNVKQVSEAAALEDLDLYTG